MILEKGVETDLDEVADLYEELIEYLNHHTNYPGWISGIYPVRQTAAEGIKGGNLYVLRINNRIAGTVILRHKPEAAYAAVDWKNNFEYKDIYVIYTLAVHPLYLKQGIGERLMELVIEHSRKMGVKAIRLDVYEKNIPAISLYERMGFDYTGTVDLGYQEYGLDYFKLYQKCL